MPTLIIGAALLAAAGSTGPEPLLMGYLGGSGTGASLPCIPNRPPALPTRRDKVRAQPRSGVTILHPQTLGRSQARDVVAVQLAANFPTHFVQVGVGRLLRSPEAAREFTGDYHVRARRVLVIHVLCRSGDFGVRNGQQSGASISAAAQSVRSAVIALSS